MKDKDITSALIGTAFFAVPYLALSVALVPSLVIGGLAFGAGELVFSGFKPNLSLKETNLSLYQKIQLAKKENKEIQNLVPKVDKSEVKETDAKKAVDKPETKGTSINELN